MNRKKMITAIMVGMILLIIAGIGGETYGNHQKDEDKLIGYQRIAAKQIKHTFADVEKIEFDKGSITRNKATGYTNVEVHISTKTEEGLLLVSLPTATNRDVLSSYAGKDTKEGVTKYKVIVKYTDDTEESI